MARMKPTETRKGGVLILLLGGRPPGMFFLAAQLQSAMIALVASRDSQLALPDVQSTLRRLLPGARFADDRIVAPYRTAEARQAIQAAAASYSNLQPYISVTGAPVPMSIAGYQAAQQLGCPAYYVNTNDGEILNLLDPDDAAPLVVQITVRDYLAFYDLAPDEKHNPPGPHVGGHWLEHHVARVARGLHHLGKPLYDDCAYGFRFLRVEAGREVDFIGVHAGMVLIASCKTGKSALKKEHLDELEAVAKKLGGDYCVRLYITDQPHPAPPRHGVDPFEQFKTQAHSAKVVVVTGDDLPRLGEILAREMLTPTYPRR